MFCGPAFYQGSASAASFNVLTLPGLLGWYDASDTLSITESGGAVSQWNDKSGNLRHAVQASGGSKFTTGGVVNSRNALLASGSGFMTLPYIDDAHTRLLTQQMYAFIVCGNADGVNGTVFLTTDASHTTPATGSYLLALAASGSGSVLNSINSTGHDFVGVGAGATNGSINVCSYVERPDLVSTISFNGTSTTSYTTLDILIEGICNYTAAYRLDGTICEVFFGNAPTGLTATQILNAYNYLVAKWITSGGGGTTITSSRFYSAGSASAIMSGASFGVAGAMSAQGSASAIMASKTLASSVFYAAGVAVPTGTNRIVRSANLSAVGVAVATMVGRLIQNSSFSAIGSSSATMQSALTSFTDTVTTNTDAYNVHDEATAAGWDGTSIITITITIDPGVVVGLFDTDFGFPVGSSITLINNGTIMGPGGNGGVGGADGVAGAGTAGGTALRAQVAMTVDNTNGVIAGGGGGAGGGGERVQVSGDNRMGGGGGGAGQGTGTPTGGAGGIPTAAVDNFAGNSGSDGGVGAGGSGGSGATGLGIGAKGGSGGNGGGLGTAGASGNAASGGIGTWTSTTPGTGGAAGNAVEGDSFITWTNTGTRYGPIT